MDRDRLIQGYVSETLSDEEINQFLHLIDTDAIFREEFEQYKNIHLAFKEKERIALKRKLQRLDVREQPSFSKSKVWMIAASVAVLLGIGGVFVFSGNVSPQELYASNYEVYPNTLEPVVRGDGAANSAPFVAYEKGNYDIAANGFLSLFEKNKNPDVLFYYAMSLMNIEGNDDEVLLQLKNLENTETRYVPQILWYSALVSLKKNDVAFARKQLKKLMVHSAKYKNREARELLKQIN